nr:hypothetical protein [Candidatus Bathyarchaeota archaeon]
MKTRWLHFGIMIICINSCALHANAQMAEFCSAPPFVTLSLKPNVMLVVDNSGSMFRFAYFDGWNTAEASDDNLCTSASNPCEEFNPNYNYYGYFDPNYWYTYESNRFYPTDRKTSRDKHSNEWDGNFLNWLTMRRIDVIRKVLTGGRVVAEGGENRLVGEPPDDCGYSDSWRGRYKRVSNAQLYTPYSGTVTFTVCGTTGTARFSVGSDTYNVKVALGDTTPQGIIQKVGNKIRWGLSFYHPNTPTPHGGYVQAAVQERDNASLQNAIVNEINNKTPDSNTPLAETLWTIAGYYAQEESMLGGPGPRYQSGDYQINTNVDPYNYGTGGQPVWAWCAKSFVLLITDGEPCADGNLPEDLKDYANGRSEFNCSSRSDDPSDPCYIPSCYGGGEGGYVPGIEDVALYVHTTDLRDDLESVQSLDIYTVFAFGAGSRLLEYAAINGGFKDLDGDGKPFFDSSCKTSDPNPYCKEWDADGDGLPDNYYEARSGSELEEALIAAITDILKRVSSGTAVSVLSTAAEGEGSIFQAYFNPVIFDGAREINWLGYLQGLWVDKYGNLREDTVQDGRLVMTEDYIVRFKVDPATGDTKVERYADSDGDGEADYRVDEKLLTEVSSFWEAGRILAQTDPSNRTIYTFRDENNNGTPQTGEFSSDWFTTDNADRLRAYLGVPDDATAQSIVSFIRGEHVDGYRDRRIGDRVWKLGDIVHSTPGVIGRPLGQYHLIYGDRTYLDFYRAHRDRKIVVYAGANDGMLHAFEAGQYHEGDDPDTDKVESGWFTANGTFGGELWAYIPYNLLPHLRWLTDPEYCHVYYVDLKPKIVDARIFADDDTHPHGWGTVLIGGMRFGGGPIQVTDDFDGDGHDEVRTFRSAYFAIDVTDPDNPQLLWEFTDPDLGYTTSYPAILRVGDPADKGTWYLIFGSGPTTLDGDSDHSGYIYVLDLATGLLKLKKDVSTIDNYLSGQPTFMASPVTVDLELDYEVDLAYIGLSYKTASGSWAGEVIRIETG